MGVIIFILGYLLDGFLSIYQEVPILNFIYLRPLFTVVAIVLIYPLFHNRKEYYKLCIIFGILYDFSYTNTLFLNALIFGALAFITEKLYSYFKNSLLNGMLINMSVIIIYKVLSFFILYLIGYIQLDIYLLVNRGINLLVLNTIFFLIVYYIISNRNNSKSFLSHLN